MLFLPLERWSEPWLGEASLRPFRFSACPNGPFVCNSSSRAKGTQCTQGSTSNRIPFFHPLPGCHEMNNLSQHQPTNITYSALYGGHILSPTHPPPTHPRTHPRTHIHYTTLYYTLHYMTLHTHYAKAGGFALDSPHNQVTETASELLAAAPSETAHRFATTAACVASSRSGKPNCPISPLPQLCTSEHLCDAPIQVVTLIRG